MKDLLSKKYYCYKIHKLLMKSSAYSPLSMENLAPFLQENLDSPFYDFSKIPNPFK